jgi:hypothetical protein
MRTTYVYWVHPVISSSESVPRLLTRLLAQPAVHAVRAVAVSFALRLRASLSGSHLSAVFHLHRRRTGHRAWRKRFRDLLRGAFLRGLALSVHF